VARGATQREGCSRCVWGVEGSVLEALERENEERNEHPTALRDSVNRREQNGC
jgi:hypothetical protein